MKKEVTALSLALALTVGMTTPVLAAEEKGPEITWLSRPGMPCSYNETLNWLTVRDLETGDFSTFDLSTGEDVGYAAVFGFTDGLAMVMDTEWRTGFIDQTGQLAIPLAYQAGFSF